MKKLQNNFTTPEQSKRLLELGVPADSADCYYNEKDYSHPRFVPIGYSFIEYCSNAFGHIKEDYEPCWSVGRLIEIWYKANRQQCSVPLSLVITHYSGADTIIEYLEKLHKEGVNFSKLEDYE